MAMVMVAVGGVGWRGAVEESEVAIVRICPSMSNLALQTAVTLA